MEVCKLCKSKHTISYKHPSFNMIFHECKDCEVIYKDRFNRVSEAKEKLIYDQHQNSLENTGYVNYLNNFLDAAVYPFIKSGKALDFGSGPNPVLSQLLNAQDLFHCDIYDYYYAKNEEVFKNKYDLITSTEVFEHLDNPLDILNRFYEILNDSGIVSIMTLFHPKDESDFFEWFYIRDPSHITFYTPKTFEILAKASGFMILDTNDYRYITLKKLPKF
ncbi:MAG: class I SAM-dependent methyltransferase [Acholeplasmataceae bacterium]|nr:class I SAM-dependent methyltransferase [Acholeplasmataceae bacterium]